MLEWVVMPSSRVSPGIKPRSPALQTDSLPSEPLGKPRENIDSHVKTSMPITVVVCAWVEKELPDTGYFRTECLLRTKSRDNEDAQTQQADLLTDQGEQTPFVD